MLLNNYSTLDLIQEPVPHNIDSLWRGGVGGRMVLESRGEGKLETNNGFTRLPVKLVREWRHLGVKITEPSGMFGVFIGEGGGVILQEDEREDGDDSMGDFEDTSFFGMSFVDT